jgi:hypothetical protein
LTAQSGCDDCKSKNKPIVARLTGVPRNNKAMGAIEAVGIVATAEPSYKGRLIRGCSARVSAAQSRAHELGSASHHRLRFSRVVRVGARQTLQPVKQLAGASVPQANGVVV